MNYTILEVANTHGGDFSYLMDLIKRYETYRGPYGMKFQPFSADTIATKDFPWYDVYTELYFTPEQWNDVFSEAEKTKDIWIDLFDEYGVDIVKRNLARIHGIKMQVSVLFNDEVIQALSDLDLSGKKLIINVAALELDQIEHFVDRISNTLQVEELLLELGFQANPTELVDSGINKILEIKSRFPFRVVFADHVEGTDEYAILLPALAIARGADVIEKHIMLDRETKYDFYSSLTPQRFETMIGHLQQLAQLEGQPFINDKEREYLQKSLMKPILRHAKSAGELIDFNKDLTFRRSGKDGLNILEIKELQNSFHVLRTSKKEGETLVRSDFKKATIAIIVAGRLKSSRLKEKALKHIGDLSSIEYCLRSACRFENVNHVILATSDLESDSELKNHTYNDSVVFHRGHPDDVIQRYLDIINPLKIDVVVRVTADMPFIDNEIGQILLKSHFEKGADFTSGSEAAVGTNVEVMNAHALRRIKQHFPLADYSEYMTWYFVNNKEHFHVNHVEFPKDLVRNYRLTLDYQEDLEMFNELHTALAPKGEFTIRDVFEYLDAHPETAAINGHMTLRYRTDQSLIDTLNKVTKIN
ncbi:MAG: N-acetylneuraminate synthase family protein [Flavobacteriales bacterium]|nr:N-acetylneuraminate synthase family protein [Flavobacteriales bacterium]